MQTINTLNAPQAIGPYVQANSFENLIFTSGQIPLNAKGELVSQEITEQTHQVLKNISQVLAAANSSLNQVIKTTCFLKNMNDFQAFNQVYSSYFKDQLPARSCVEVARLPKDVLVEIEVIAYKK